MRTVTIDCAGVEDEGAFWDLYLREADPEGTDYFGCNLNAFWDAIHGGPGYPGEVKLVFLNSEILRRFTDGVFFHHLQEIARDQQWVPIEFR
jgi:RNAse (barnase) inhibitor barstar